MGTLTFRLPPAEVLDQRPGMLSGYMTGMDRTPVPTRLEVDGDLLRCHRETHESGRLVLAWPVMGYGHPMIATATLAERARPYDLAVELARGRLNDVRNQLSDWVQLGLRTSDEVHDALGRSRKNLTRAALCSEDRNEAYQLASVSLEDAFLAADRLMDQYIDQVIDQRMVGRERLGTRFGFVAPLTGGDEPAWAETLAGQSNAVRIACTWRHLAPTEGPIDWSTLDARLEMARRHDLRVGLGPLIEFRAGAFPDWLWLWEGNIQTIQSLALDLVRQVILRYRGQVDAWHLVHRPAVGRTLGLGPNEQIWLTVKIFQVARQHDPETPLLLDVDRPWAEWLTTSEFPWSPLHLANDLHRADLGLAGLGVEVAPGYSSPGSHYRDLFDFSRLLDFYSLLNLPLHVNLVMPSESRDDPMADPQVRVMKHQWPEAPTAETHARRAERWISLAASKPFVRSVYWGQPSDAVPHLYPHGGLFDGAGEPKPLLDRMGAFYRSYFA